MTRAKLMDEKVQWCVYQFRRLGWQGQLAMFLLACTMVLFFIIQANTAEADRLRLVIDELQHTVPADVHREKQANYIAKRFYDALPSEDEANQKIADLLNTLEQHDLVLNRSAYSTRAVSQSPLMLYHIKFPLVAQYPTIRRFVTDIMNSQRTMALSHINFKRDDLNSDMVSANIELILYTKTAGKD